MNKKLLVLLPAAAMILVGCANNNKQSSSNNNSSSITESNSQGDSGSQGETSQGGNTSSAQGEKVEAVQISDTAITLDLGGFKDLSAVAKPGTLSDKTVVWSSDHPEIATVSTQGRVTAVAAGTATITAASHLDPSVKATCTVTVNSKKVLAYAYTPVIGEKYVLGTYQGNNAVKANIYAKFADFDEANGRFDTTKNFSEAAEITLENGSVNGKYHVKVTNGTTNKYLNLRGGTDYHITLGDSAVTDWSWNDEYSTIVATSDSRTNFVGTYNNYTTLSSCDILQAPGDFVCHLYQQADPAAATSIEIYPNQNLSCNAGASLTLQARIMPMGAQDSKVTWSVSGNDKVTVDQNGKVSIGADATGTVKVQAKVTDSVKAEVTVTIKEALNYGTKEAPLTTAQAKALLDKIGVGVISEQKMYVTGIVCSASYDSSYKNFTVWLDGTNKSDGGFELYATVLGAGVEDYSTKAAELKGKTVIACGYGENYSGTYELTKTGSGEATVYPEIIDIKDGPAIEATAIALDKTTAEVGQGGVLQLKATLTPVTASTPITWSVTGNEKVTVDQTGKVTVAADAVAGSTATVTATAGKVSASCVITVTAEKVNYGTIDAPLSITEAKAVIDKAAAGAFTPEKITVTGEVFSQVLKNSTYNQYEIWLKDGATDKAFELWSTVFDSSITGFEADNSLVGKTIVAQGFAKNYNGTYELTNNTVDGTRINPTIYKVADGAVKSKYGTIDLPLTITEAKAVIDETTAGAFTPEKITVTGEVFSQVLKNSTYNQYEIWLKDGATDKAFELWSTVFDSSITGFEADNSLVGKTIVAQGFAKNYNGTYELTNNTVDGTRINPIIYKVEGGTSGGNDDGGQTTSELLKLTPASITQLNPSESSGYAKCNGTRKVGNYDVTTQDVMANGLGGLSGNAIQIKKGTGKLTVSNIKVTKLHLVCGSTSTSDIGAGSVCTIAFGSSNYSFTANQISAAWAAKTACGTAKQYVLDLEINATAAANLVISGPTDYTGYFLEIAIY
ncbi:MAG: Ig-like domain-containing protein [Bacilli bacterium]|nr:Ig-like domain-containing protein [Bacilli bacterium]